jgi:hypothetical protein
VFTEPLPRNGHCLQSHYLATGIYAIIYKASSCCAEGKTSVPLLGCRKRNDDRMDKYKGWEKNTGRRREKTKDVKNKGREDRNNFPHHL